MSDTYQSPASKAAAPSREEPPHKWTGSRFKRVRENAHLFWPNEYQQPQHRGAAGYIIDTENELEARWCAGQFFKLEDAPDVKAADPIVHQIALGEMTTLARIKNPPAPPEQYQTPKGAKAPASQHRKPAHNFKEIEG